MLIYVHFSQFLIIWMIFFRFFKGAIPPIFYSMGFGSREGKVIYSVL